jgi:hypothetical protein
MLIGMGLLFLSVFIICPLIMAISNRIWKAVLAVMVLGVLCVYALPAIGLSVGFLLAALFLVHHLCYTWQRYRREQRNYSTWEESWRYLHVSAKQSMVKLIKGA